MAQLSSHITNKAGKILRPGRWRTSGARAAPISRWRELTSSVIAAISSRSGGTAHSPTATNSEPPAKLAPHISGTCQAVKPLAPAWAPSTSAIGRKPISTGSDSFTPRQNSAPGETCGAIESEEELKVDIAARVYDLQLLCQAVRRRAFPARDRDRRRWR